MAEKEGQKSEKKAKKKYLGVLLGLAVIAISSAIVYAYLKDDKHTLNEVTIGNNTIEIQEEFVPPVKQLKNTIFKKKVQVKNTGNVSCYVRVYADFSDGEIRKISYISNYSDASPVLDEARFSDGAYVDTLASGITPDNPYHFYKAGRDTTDSDNYVNHLPEGWVFIPDDATGDDAALSGYYYYTKKVAPGEVTPSLFRYFLTTYPDTDQIQQFDVLIYAESVQVTDSNGYDFTDDTAPDGDEAWKKAWKAFLQ
ncbi:MAG: hypothetical protein II919_00430 [Lachnospiraceae bacterium]|nr:hypothetical protein [Lachnospiraceae bacterium]